MFRLFPNIQLLIFTVSIDSKMYLESVLRVKQTILFLNIHITHTHTHTQITRVIQCIQGILQFFILRRFEKYLTFQNV